MIRTLVLAGASALVLVACTGEQKPKAVTYTVSEFIGPSPFHGLHGLAVEPDGTILAGSVVGQAIYVSATPAKYELERVGGEVVEQVKVRFRTVGDMTCTCPVESDAADAVEVVAETLQVTVSERGATRMDDRTSDASMERRKKEGYF